jgi:hypothetical protein
MIKSSNTKNVAVPSSLSRGVLTRQQLRSVGGAGTGGYPIDPGSAKGDTGGPWIPPSSPPNNNNG